nr:calcium/sodium antiporter [Thiohalomonas denitrificans]
MLSSSLAVLAGFALLVWGADRFVEGAAAIARNLGVTPMVIGLTVVGVGTSAPEILVSATAAWAGSPDMGVGNAIGSNITNVALVLGATAVITPLAVRSETLRREFPLLLVVMLIALGLLLDGHLGRLDGVLLVLGMGLVIYWIVNLALRQRAGGETDPLDAEYSNELPPEMGTARAIFWLLLGITVLVGSSRLLVWGAVNIAQWFEVPDLIIGLTIIALGTSLPELAASIMSALKGEHDIAIGNVLGSNMFNLLAVLGMPGLIHPAVLQEDILTRDYPIMIGLSVALFAMAYGFRKPGHISRTEGGILLAAYVGYLWLLYESVQGAGA